MKKFTLIELLILLAILAILLSLLLPSLSKAREHTKKAVCQSNLKQTYIASLSYAKNWNNWTPASIGWNVPTSSPWRAVLREYVNSEA